MASRTTKKKPKTAKVSKRPSKAANGPPPPMGEVFTLTDAAAFLRVSEEGLKADAVIGRVPGRFVAGEWRFVRGTLLAWLSQPEKQASTPKAVPSNSLRLEETPEEYEAFMASIQAFRDEVDRATSSGKYAAE